MALKSLLTRAASTGQQAARKARHGEQQDGWSDGWHTQASTLDSLRILRDSAAVMAKSTAQTATTQEGWRRIVRGAGKVVGGAAVVAGGVAQRMLKAEESEEQKCQTPRRDGWGDGHAGYGYYFGGWRMDDDEM